MTNHQFDNFKQYLVKGTTGAKVNWLRCMLFYNNLHRFTRLICPSDRRRESYTGDWSEIGWFPRVTFFLGIKFGVNELISFQRGHIYCTSIIWPYKSIPRLSPVMIILIPLHIQKFHINSFVCELFLSEFLYIDSYACPLNFCIVQNFCALR